MILSFSDLDFEILSICLSHIIRILSLGIAGKRTLTQLFTEGGCDDLLDLEGFWPILQTDVKVKNADALLSYLENSP
jgi:hypothetical protein